jgi:hypothetical protein
LNVSEEDDPVGLRDLLRAADVCIKENLHLPALVLIYSGIDTLGWLAADPEKSVRDSFTDVVERYLLPGSAIKATSLELYAARCAIVHTYTSESKLSQSGQARMVAYAWGRADDGPLQESIDRLGHPLVAVHLNALRAGLERAIPLCMADIKADPPRHHRMLERATKRYGPVSTSAVRTFLGRGREGAGG